MIFFEIYEDDQGKSPFLEYLDGLSTRHQVAVYRRIEAIRTVGIKVSSENQWVKSLKGTNLFEIRIRVGSNQERVIYFHDSGHSYVITHGFTKKTQKTPVREIQRAKKIMDKYEKRDPQ